MPGRRDTDRRAISLDNLWGVVVGDYDDPGPAVDAHYAVGVRFIYPHADELATIRLGVGPRSRFCIADRAVGGHDSRPPADRPSRHSDARGRRRGRLVLRPSEIQGVY
jgi:hypothetical protein